MSGVAVRRLTADPVVTGKADDEADFDGLVKKLED